MRKFKGQDVRNSQRRLRIDVTETDVKKGTPLDPENCAAAECIKRQLGAHAVSVHRGVVLIQRKPDGKYERYLTPSDLRMEEIIFDRGGMFMAGEYDLRPVPPKEAYIRKPSSAPRSPKQMQMAIRRRVIPGVRRSARSTTGEDDG